MNKRELLEIIRNSESSGVEFKCDDIPIQDLAREIVAFANYQPVPGATLADLDQRRLRQYFEEVLGQSIPKQDAEWCHLLETVDFMT